MLLLKRRDLVNSVKNFLMKILFHWAISNSTIIVLKKSLFSLNKRIKLKDFRSQKVINLVQIKIKNSQNTIISWRPMKF